MTQHRTNRLSISLVAVGMLSAALLSGCVVNGGGGSSGGLSTGSNNTTTSTGPSAGGDPRTYFINNVYPKLSVCAGCHASGAAGAPIYLASDGAGSYEKIKTFKELYTADSAILHKGSHAGGAGPALTPDQTTVIQTWLSLEFSGSGSNPGTDQPTPTNGGGTTKDGKTMGDLATAWGDCMHRGDWNNDGMQGWSLLQTIGYGPCVGCHEIGNAGTFLNDDADVTFDNNRNVPYVYRLVLAKYDTSGQLVGLQPSKRLIEKSKLTVGFNPTDPNYIHPAYNVPQVLQQALTSFQSATFERIDDTNTCTEPEPRQ